MLDTGALRELILEKWIMNKGEFIAKFNKLDREMKEEGEKNNETWVFPQNQEVCKTYGNSH